MQENDRSIQQGQPLVTSSEPRSAQSAGSEAAQQNQQRDGDASRGSSGRNQGTGRLGSTTSHESRR